MVRNGRLKRHLLAAAATVTAALGVLGGAAAPAMAEPAPGTVCWVNGSYGYGMYDGTYTWRKNATYGAAFVYDWDWGWHNNVHYAAGHLAGENPDQHYLMIRSTITC
ncbi:hypothetical protein [Patulibacter defluvii]|uniref:hypothetical protein n=1 Tax=Patulibacter defluvii TaxID=3095358 RepID=UPI002A75AC8F|nr:hypothetical protein [Patulibacter sp. DM4]